MSMSHPLTRSTDRISTSSDDNTIKGSHRARPKGKANENANDSSKPLTSTRSKRLFTEQTNSIDSGDELSTKRHKQRQISLKHTLNNLDKPFVKTSKEGPQAQPSVPDLPCVASCAGSESDDADDEEDAHAHDDIPSAKLPDVDLAPLGPKEIPSLTKIPLSDDDLFGASDSTLTSVSDDSEDDVEPQKATEAPKDASTMSLRSRRSSRSSPSKVVVPELPLPLPLVAPVKRGPGRPRKDGSAPQPRIRPPPSTYTRTRRTPLPKTEQEDLTIPAVDSQPSDQSLMSRTLRSRAQSENISEDDTEDSLAIQKMLLTLPKKSSSDATASDPEVKATRSSFKPPKEHVFLKPQIPLRRGSNGSARSVPYVRSPPRPSHRPPTPSTVPVPFKTKLFHATPSLPPAKFKMPSPSPPSIGQISSQLRLALQQGLRKVLDTNTTTASEPTEDITSTPTREQVEEARHLERKALIAEAYLVLEQTLNSPQSCAELNKLLTGDLLHAMGGLEPLALPKPEDDKDRLECQHCQRTYKNRRGLSSHIRRCTARQPSDGEATASETEDQRKAKCLSTKDHSEEEEGVIKCVCGSKEDEGDFVQCDDCKAWLHLECVGLSVDKVPDEYYCPPCQQPSMSMTGGKSSRRVYRATNNASNDFDDSDASDNSSSTSPLWKYRAEMEARKQRHEARYEDGPSEATSPQVVLNHDWVEEPSGELGFGGEYMSAQLAAAARSIFKEPCSLALMLDGSSSQEVASSPVPDPLHSSPAIYDDHVFHAYDDGPTAGLELAFGADSPFETVQPIKYFSETNDLLPPHFMELDSSGSFDQLLSDDTIDSDGLRTPLDLHYDSHLASMWEMETMDAPSGKTPLEIDLEVEQTLQAQEDWLYN